MTARRGRSVRPLLRLLTVVTAAIVLMLPATAAADPLTIWPTSATPSHPAVVDGNVELGVRFRSSQAGAITALRFYKATNETASTHVGKLWSNDGTELASVTFTSESASGWQQATLSSPVPVVADTTYVASYFASTGYAVDVGYFEGVAVTRGPLAAISDGVGSPNGVYAYGGGFPTNTYRSSNYWVDIVFEPATAPSPVDDPMTLWPGSATAGAGPGRRRSPTATSGGAAMPRAPAAATSRPQPLPASTSRTRTSGQRSAPSSGRATWRDRPRELGSNRPRRRGAERRAQRRRRRTAARRGHPGTASRIAG